jgi:hypothetical protein
MLKIPYDLQTRWTRQVTNSKVKGLQAEEPPTSKATAQQLTFPQLPTPHGKDAIDHITRKYLDQMGHSRAKIIA